MTGDSGSMRDSQNTISVVVFLITTTVLIQGYPAFAKKRQPTPQPVATDIASLSRGFHQAKRTMLAAVHDYPCPGGLITSMSINYEGIHINGFVRGGGINLNEFQSTTLSLPFNDVAQIGSWGDVAIGCTTPTDHGGLVIETRSHQPGKHVCFFFGSEQGKKQFEDGLYWMVNQSAQLASLSEAEHAEFEKAIVQWQSASVKPAMPETAHEHQVLAANAYQEKNFDKAIDEYEAALEIFPAWPEGQNNIAFLCGETGDYDCAIEHAQDYLLLVPNASNAKDLKDRIIIWKDKLTQIAGSAAGQTSVAPRQHGVSGVR